jgi:adenine-specific DNA methylase
VSDRSRYPKRLIEVDLPIKRISAHARREKSIRHGHISTLHIWWARRPLAACRAVICAALWPDPADQDCPVTFVDHARKEMLAWTSHERQKLLSKESRKRFEAARQKPTVFDNGEQLRGALLDFIADFANWDNSTVKEYLETSRSLTQAAHEALGGAPGTRPLVVDPFAGGGSIPLEALRVGADAYASDLNPVPVLLNKVILEYIPKYGQNLSDWVRKWGEWIRKEAEKDLAEFYPKDPDGATPVAYLWARTIKCEGPGCGAEVPLIRSLWLARKSSRSVALQMLPRPKAKRVDFQVILNKNAEWVDQDNPNRKIKNPVFEGTVKAGSANCPCCGYTTTVQRVREQLKPRHGGSQDARLFCVVTRSNDVSGKNYRMPRPEDLVAGVKAKARLAKLGKRSAGAYPAIPNEPTPPDGTGSRGGGYRTRKYGVTTYAHFFNARQLLQHLAFSDILRRMHALVYADLPEEEARAVEVILALTADRQVDRDSAFCRWIPQTQAVGYTFGRQAIPMLWDFVESPALHSSGGWPGSIEGVCGTLEILSRGLPKTHCGQAEYASATNHPLPDDSCMCLFTDPPYYDSVPYAELSDFFFVWLKRAIGDIPPVSQFHILTPREEECVVNLAEGKDKVHFQKTMTSSLVQGRRVCRPDGIGVVVFAHKSTAGWESQLQALLDAGWVITASWPVDTERAGRLRAIDSAALASSVHLVCRPRENPDGSIRDDEIGDWRDILAELPCRIHEWMPRLAEEGVVGADAIFACLGPALEIFSRYSRVEKASGETVTLKEYLEQVWAAVAKEALAMIFTGADTSGFEEDARLTAMWLWTLKTGETNGTETEATEEESGDEEEGGGKKAGGGFALEFDAARKIAQGLGAHLEDLQSLVDVAGETARLLPVAERAHHLFGAHEGKAATVRKKRRPQMDLFDAGQQVAETESSFGKAKIEHVGATVLDQIHQSMILFAAGRGEALKRFLIEDGAGQDQRFWRLAQALSALYPGHTEEKRWVDGVLARKKGLGF